MGTPRKVPIILGNPLLGVRAPTGSGLFLISKTHMLLISSPYKIRSALKGGCRGYIGVIQCLGFRVSQNQGCLLGGPYNKDYSDCSILGSILGVP